MRNFTVKLLSTFLYAGYLPLVPGTFASLLGVGLFYLTKNNPFIYALSTLSLIILGFLTAGKAEKLFGRKDASCIVIDEVSGMLLSFMFIPYEIQTVVIAFIVFRIIDALKPYPAGSLQNLKGSLGIMCDDIVAGLYTNIVLQVVLKLASLRAS
jgi:phosphatidylglycerophosphatase A